MSPARRDACPLPQPWDEAEVPVSEQPIPGTCPLALSQSQLHTEEVCRDPGHTSSEQCTLPWGRLRKDPFSRILRDPKTTPPKVSSKLPFSSVRAFLFEEAASLLPILEWTLLGACDLHTRDFLPPLSMGVFSSGLTAPKNQVNCPGAPEYVTEVSFITLKELSYLPSNFTHKCALQWADGANSPILTDGKLSWRVVYLAQSHTELGVKSGLKLQGPFEG